MTAIETLDRSSVLVAEQVGRRRYRTPEGYLFCEAVRIARTGDLLYSPNEVPDVEPLSGLPFVTITRDRTELFHPDVLASFLGKPVTNNHPPEMLDPGSHKAYAVGHAVNVYAGEGIDADYMLADLLITDQTAIRDVENGKKEVSCGYMSEYEQERTGYGRQYNIRGNHIALVERGRCGPSCAIRDHEREDPMSNRRTWRDRVRAAFKAKDEAALEQELAKPVDEKEEDEVKDQDTSDPIAAIMARLEEVSKTIGEMDSRLCAMEAKGIMDGDDENKKDGDPEPTKDGDDEDKEEEKDDESSKTMDRASVTAASAPVFAAAEVLAPGVRLPTFDASPTRGHVASQLADLRRSALQTALKDSRQGPLIRPVLAGSASALATLDAATIEVLFAASAEVVKAANRRPLASNDSMGPNPTNTIQQHTPASLQELLTKRRAAITNAAGGRT